MLNGSCLVIRRHLPLGLEALHKPEDKMIDGIWVQNASGADLPKFYVTEIHFQ